MKRCPECRRDYYDDTLLYCLEDGVALVQGSVTAPDEPKTAILPSVVEREVFGERPTRNLPVGTQRHYGADGFWVAVKPLKFDGADANVAALAEGLSEGIVSGLARFSYLKVISETADYENTQPSYVIDGTIRKAGSMLRLTVQVVDCSTGASLWAEKYDLAFQPEDMFDIQDKLVPLIVSSIADMHGVLPRTMGERLRMRPVEELSPYEALVRSFDYFQRVTPVEWQISLKGVEGALEKAPGYATLRAMRGLLLVQGYAQGFDGSQEGLEFGADEARRAVEESSSDHLAWFALAQALFFKKEFVSLPTAVKRSLSLNPMDGNATALFGEFISYAGDWSWGLELAAAARDLNPNFPGWYWHTNFNDAYRRREYQEALDIALKMNINSSWGAQVLTASAYGQLGENVRAVHAFEEADKIRPNLSKKVVRELRVWFNDEHANHLLEGLLKAGIRVDDTTSASTE